MRTKHKATLQSVFQDPVLANVRWADIESMLIALGAECSEGNGSRVRFLLNDVPAVFHRPHPAPTTDRGTLRSVRKFLIDAGIKP